MRPTARSACPSSKKALARDVSAQRFAGPAACLGNGGAFHLPRLRHGIEMLAHRHRGEPERPRQIIRALRSAMLQQTADAPAGMGRSPGGGRIVLVVGFFHHIRFYKYFS